MMNNVIAALILSAGLVAAAYINAGGFMMQVHHDEQMGVTFVYRMNRQTGEIVLCHADNCVPFPKPPLM